MARTSFFNVLKRCLNLAWSAECSKAESREHVEMLRDSWRLSRREFLQSSLKAVMLPAIPFAQGQWPGLGGMSPRSGVRIAVIGAGMAGLHCAYRLKQSGIHSRIYEASERIGGRIFTARGIFANDQVVELGGEFIDSDHLCMHALASELGVKLDNLYRDNPSDYREDIWYIGGRFVTETEIVELFRPVAVRMAETVTATNVDEAEFAQIDAMSISEWLNKVAEADSLIRNIIDIAYTGEYGLDAEEQSVFNLLYQIDYDNVDPFRIFGDSDERYHVHPGNDTITARLAERLERQIRLGMQLLAVTELPNRQYRLTFDQRGTLVDKVFDYVVFALPFSLLRDIKLSVELPEKKLQVIRELGYGTNAKLIGQFNDRIWREKYAASGSAFTDNGLQNIWDASIGQPGTSGILTNFLGGRAGVQLGLGRTEEQMHRALALIDQIFPGTSKAYVKGSAIRMHWPSAAFQKGSYSCYRPGQWAFHGIERKRVGNLHFCGEHCSLGFQGYMEGAFETGAMVAAEIINDLGLAQTSSTLRNLVYTTTKKV